MIRRCLLRCIFGISAVAAVFLFSDRAAAQIVICDDRDLQITPVSPQQFFATTQLEPMLLSIRVTDGCGQAVRAVAARAEFSNGDLPVVLTPAFSAGVWSGIWQSRNRPGEEARIIFTAINVGSDSKPAGVLILEGKIAPRTQNADLSVDGSALRTSGVAGGPPEFRPITISNPAGTTQPYRARLRLDNGNGWGSLLEASGTVPAAGKAAAVLKLDAANLLPGTYAGTVDVEVGTRTVSKAVTFAVSGARALIELSTTAATFTGRSDGRAEPAQQLVISNKGTGPLEWTVQASTSSGGPWLRISSPQGTTAPGGATLLQVSANPAGLAPGEYFGQVRFNAPAAANNPQIVAVQLRVGGNDTSLGSFVRPTALVSGGGNAQPTISYFNGAAQAVQLRIVTATADRGGWLSTSARTLIVPAGQSAQLPVIVAASPSTGTRTGAISVVNIAEGTSFTIPVLDLPPGAGSAGDSKGRLAACAPARLTSLFTSVSTGATLRTGESKTIQASIRDNCGTPVSKGNGAVEFAAGGETISMRDAGGGTWAATWVPKSDGQQVLTLTAFMMGANGRFWADQQIVTVNVQGASNKPVLAAGGIVDGASFKADRIAPGSLITIFGSDLSDGTAAPASSPIPTTIANTRIELGGQELPIFFASPTQLNAQLPYNIGTNTDLPLIVTRATQQSAPVPIIVSTAQPAIFTADQSGQGQATILGPDQRTLADPANPVRTGDAVVIYCTGLGATSPAVAPGEPAPLGPTLAQTTAPVMVTIGGMEARVLFSGLAPGFAGLYQVNAIVPAGVQPGNAVPVRLRSADLLSPPVTIAVRQ